MAVGGVAADVIADGSGFGPSLRRVLARHQNESVDVDVRVRRGAIDRLTREGQRAGRGFSRGFSSGLSDIGRAFGDIGRRLGSIAPQIGRIGAIGTGILFAGAAAAVAAAQITAFVAALAPAVGIIAGLPAVLGVAAAGITTLVVAFQGMGEAVSAALADDVEAFEEALEGVSPAAAETARALRDIAPAWSALRETVQESFFDGLADQLTNVSDALVGPLEAGMSQAAASLSGLTQGFADVIASERGVEFISGSFDVLSNVIDNISEPLANLLDAFFAVGNAINEAFGGETAGSGLADMIQSFADWLDAAAESGQAVQWVEDAFEVFRQIGAILAPIGGIFASIGSAAEEASGGILGTFGAALQALDDFLSSAEGTAFLGELFGALGELGAALGPVFSALGSALTPLLAIAGDLVATLAPGIEMLITALGEGLAAAAPALLPLGDALVSIVAAVSPLLPMIGTLLGIFVEIGAFLLSAFAPVLQVVVGLFTAIVQPQLETWLTFLSELFAELSPVIERLTETAMKFIEPLMEIGMALSEALLPILMELIPVFAGFAAEIGDKLVGAMEKILPYALEFVAWLVNAIETAAPFIEMLASISAAILGHFVGAFANAIGMVIDLGVWFFELGVTIRGFVSTAVGWIQGFRDDVIAGFKAVGDWIDNLVGWFMDLPGRILGAIGDLGSQIWDSITSGFGELGDWIGFANGGIITSPTVAALAEDGRPEVVIPLTKPARAQQLAQESGLTQILNVGSTEQRSPANVTINVNGGDLREVRRTIEDVMAEYA